MEGLVVVVGLVLAIFPVARLAWGLISSARESGVRSRLEQEIRAIANDLGTGIEGVSVRQLVESLEVEAVREVLARLRRMPPGKRKLSAAIDATFGENEE